MPDDEIPNDAAVVAAIGGVATSPSDVLQRLMGQGHSRAASQRAMQRALDRDKITFNSDLKFVVTQELAAA